MLVLNYLTQKLPLFLSLLKIVILGNFCNTLIFSEKPRRARGERNSVGVPSCSPFHGETFLCREPLTFSCLGAASAASLPWLVPRSLAKILPSPYARRDAPEGREWKTVVGHGHSVVIILLGKWQVMPGPKIFKPTPFGGEVARGK